MKFETNIAKSTKDSIHVHGYDLVEELIGKVTLADMAFLGATHRMPSKNETEMLNALMVAVCEHGFTPSSVSTRLTYLGAPESVQSAVASGLLGAGTVYLGAMEYVAEMVQNAIKEKNGKTIAAMAEDILNEYESKKKELPGFGHPLHKPVDPRTVKLFQLSKDLGIEGTHTLLIKEISHQLNKRKNKEITLNAVGAIGAILSDMGLHFSIVKTFAVGARAIGLIAHIVEEQELGKRNSIGQRLYNYMEEHTEYRSENIKINN